jgi:3-hydroxybutyryl-CoA dehydrogenase
MSIATAGVVGLGTMGAGIVEVFAKTGVDVVAVEINEDALERGRTILSSSLQRAIDKGRLSPSEAEAVQGRVSWTTSFDDLASVDLVIEAVPERLDIKLDLFSRLDALCQPETILATNTSSLSVTQIAAATGRADRVIGMHFFNPAPVMKLVEIITTVLTDDAVTDAVTDLASRCGKTPVAIGDRAGFIVNTLMIGYLNEAVRLFEESVVDRDALDAGIRLGAGLPMGPLALCDLIGLDVVLEIVDVLFAESRDPFHAAAPLLRAMVSANLLGRKTGRGFYTYDRPGSGRVVDAATEPAVPDLSGRSVAAVGRGAEFVAVRDAAVDAGAQLDTFDSVAAAVAGGSDVVLVELSPQELLRDVVVGLNDRARVVGVHALHRGPKGRSVEIVRSPFTDADALGLATSVVQAAEGTPVVCDDRAGMVVSRLLAIYLNDAARMLEAGYASPTDIDAAMRLGGGYPVGPFEFLNAMTSDPIVTILRRVHAETGQGRHAPNRLLQESAAYGVPVTALVAQS